MPMRTFVAPAPRALVLACLFVAAGGGCSEEEPGGDRVADAAVDAWVGSGAEVGASVGTEVGTEVGTDAGVADANPAPCRPGTVRRFGGTSEVIAAIAGRWRYCGGSEPSAFKGKAIELTVDGNWFELEPDTAGALVRQMSPGRAGQFTISPSSAPGGTVFDIVISYNNAASTYGTELVLTAEPRRLELGPDYLMPVD